jgi:hypothetical protein
MLVFCFLAATLAGAGLCAYASPTAFAKQLADALNLSSLTAPGSQPFLLKLEATNTRQHDPQYNAEIEIWWAAPDKWHRQVKSPAFSQTAIQNGLPQAFKACGSITALQFDSISKKSSRVSLNLAVEGGRSTSTSRVG